MVAAFFMRTLIEAFDRQFLKLHVRSSGFIVSVPDCDLYRKPVPATDVIMKLTVGENILRSAAFVEMAFGGITTRLWDDPFEWTLPEALSTTGKIAGYLSEVEVTRLHGFAFFTSDDDLSRAIPAPRDVTPICEILLETLLKAEHYQGRAFALFQTLTGGKPTRR